MSDNIEQTVVRIFVALFFGDMTESAFRQWVFTTPDIADVVGDDTYVRLLDIEYGLSSAKEDIADTVHAVQVLESAHLLRAHIHTILCGLLNRTIPVISASHYPIED